MQGWNLAGRGVQRLREGPEMWLRVGCRGTAKVAHGVEASGTWRLLHAADWAVKSAGQIEKIERGKAPS